MNGRAVAESKGRNGSHKWADGLCVLCGESASVECENEFLGEVIGVVSLFGEW